MSSPTDIEPPRLIAIGNFDGVHRGHQQVLSRAVGLAQQLGIRPTVVTFAPHPAEVIRGAAPPLLTRLDEKLRLLREIPGIKDVIVLPFDHELAALSPEVFVEKILLQQLHARAILVGANFRFGKGRAGDLGLLQEIGKTRGFQAESFALAEFDGEPFSSTRIRHALSAGELSLACQMLGRPHAFRGQVVAGDGRGRQLGFPTANLIDVQELLPPAGVYAVLVTIQNRPQSPPHSSEQLQQSTSKTWAGVLHLGARPTVGRPESLEVHLFEFAEDLYGCELKVELIGRLRGVERFESVDALKQQITADIASARRLIQAEALP